MSSQKQQEPGWLAQQGSDMVRFHFPHAIKQSIWRIPWNMAKETSDQRTISIQRSEEDLCWTRGSGGGVKGWTVVVRIRSQLDVCCEGGEEVEGTSFLTESPHGGFLMESPHGQCVKQNKKYGNKIKFVGENECFWYMVNLKSLRKLSGNVCSWLKIIRLLEKSWHFSYAFLCKNTLWLFWQPNTYAYTCLCVYVGVCTCVCVPQEMGRGMWATVSAIEGMRMAKREEGSPAGRP